MLVKANMKPFDLASSNSFFFYKKQSHPFPFPSDVLEKYLLAGSRTDVHENRQQLGKKLLYYTFTIQEFILSSVIYFFKCLFSNFT